MIAIGQENAFTWIERDIGIDFDEWGMPVIDKTTYQSTLKGVFFGGATTSAADTAVIVSRGHLFSFQQ